MTLRHIPIDQINQTHLQRLIDVPVSENRDIEYKRDAYGKADRDHGEFLADVSSFANTTGGDIILGMDAQAGIPTMFAPLQIDLDGEILRLESISRAGLQPRIFGLVMRAVRIAGGGGVLLIRTPRSYNQPHRIVRQGHGHHRFFARSSAGKYEPNVDELRLLFTRAPQLADRIRDFRFDRIAKIVANDVAVPLMGANSLIMHVAPLSAFDGRPGLRLDTNQDPQLLYKAFPPIGAQIGQIRINVDGVLILSNLGTDGRSHRAYVQAFHSGIIEAVDSLFLMGEGTAQRPFRLTSMRMEATIVGASHRYLQSLQSRDAQPPFVVLISLIGVKDVPYSFAVGSTPFGDEAGIFDRDQFHFSEAVIEDVPSDPYEYAGLIRPLLDQTAHAAGRATSPSFDQQGRFLLRV